MRVYRMAERNMGIESLYERVHDRCADYRTEGEPDFLVRITPADIDRERQLVDKMRRLEDLVIPEDFNFDQISGLTIECRQKFKRYAPRTIGQASRISGVSPSDISVLLVYFGR